MTYEMQTLDANFILYMPCYALAVRVASVLEGLRHNVGGVCDVEKANTKLYLKY
jgi:hypothetical protein